LIGVCSASKIMGRVNNMIISFSLGQCFWLENGDNHVTSCGGYIDYDMFERNFKSNRYSGAPKFKFCPNCGKEITFDENTRETCHEPKVYTLNESDLGPHRETLIEKMRSL
jgi:predicted RNA-binding Zn-ribbon protein involved in translation (DUF1610 family)